MLKFLNINNKRGTYFDKQYTHYEQIGLPFPNVSDFYKLPSYKKFDACLKCRAHCDNLHNTTGFSYIGGAIWGNTFSFSYCTLWKYAGLYFYICECPCYDYIIGDPEIKNIIELVNYSYYYGDKYYKQKKERAAIIENYTINTVDKLGRPARFCVLDDYSITALSSSAYLNNWAEHHQNYNIKTLKDALECYNIDFSSIPVDDVIRVKVCSSYSELMEVLSDVIRRFELSLEYQLEKEREEWSLYLDAVL